VTAEIIIAILGAAGTVGAAVVGLLQIQIKAEHDAVQARQQAKLEEAEKDIGELKDERIALRETIEKQAAAIAEQAGRLTITIEALTRVTLERDWLKVQNANLQRQVETLTAERDMLVRVEAELRAQLARLQDRGDPAHA
jgi:aspartate-semialdehyde dehydrogenase